jgi:hypothetical protein
MVSPTKIYFVYSIEYWYNFAVLFHQYFAIITQNNMQKSCSKIEHTK